jgi:hypothetical protein
MLLCSRSFSSEAENDKPGTRFSVLLDFSETSKGILDNGIGNMTI